MTPPSRPAAPSLILGLGNPYRGDDGVGPRVAALLQEAGLSAQALDCDGAELIESFQDQRWVVVIDAAESAEVASGACLRFEAEREPLPAGLLRHSSHQFGLAEGIETARSLGLLPPRLTVYAIAGETFALGSDLSPAVEHTAQTVAADLIAQFCQT